MSDLTIFLDFTNEIIAALVANGETNIHRIYHLDRGYENLEGKLSLIGADVKRFTE